MLTSLGIKNLAIIPEAEFDPSKGLNVISGETGAGKTLLIDAISLIMGSKASKALVGNESDEAFVEAVFDLSDMKDKEFSGLLKEYEIEPEDDTLIISRKVTREGKSSARINNKTVVLSVLKEVSSCLIDIHGQHDTQKIFDDKYHITLLDTFGAEEVGEARKVYLELLDEYKNIYSEIKKLSKSPEETARRKEYLEFAVKEITNAGFKPGEDTKLKELKKRYQSNMALAVEINNADCMLNGSDNEMSAAAMVQSACNSYKKLSDADSAHKDIFDRLENITLELQSIASEVASLRSGLDFSPEKMDEIDNRLSDLYSLEAKYGDSIEEINEFKESAEKELELIEKSADILKELRQKRSEVEQKLLSAAEKLTDKRREAAKTLSEAATVKSERLVTINVSKGGEDLEMPDAVFSVDFKRRPKEKFFSLHGIDDVSFMFSANIGHEPRALSETASGGEASRIMLAIKTVLSRFDTIPTLIFDEIDTGVSGKAANGIAHKLKSISKDIQVLCVSHTAQIAAGADSNFLLSKSVKDGVTGTSCQRLKEQEVVKEVARLLSGDTADESVKLAEQLIKSYR